MKGLFLSVFLIVLLFSRFVYAEDVALNSEARNAHSSHHRKHALLKAQKNMAPVDINHANQTDLATLKGVGLKKAQAIITYRDANGPFKSVDDLAHVKGIGKKSVARLQENNPGRIIACIKNQSALARCA